MLYIDTDPFNPFEFAVYNIKNVKIYDLRKLKEKNEIKTFDVFNNSTDFLKVKYNKFKENEILFNSNDINNNTVYIANTVGSELKVSNILIQFGHYGHTCTVLDFSINKTKDGILKIASVSNDNMINIWTPDDIYL